ncbi:MAG: hypothetical protein IPM29_00570 [Planctomycetes bacterium]|nr:hypothetical protein [Planctomycetota bacterium]
MTMPRRSLCLFAAALASAASAQVQWTSLSPANAPPPRGGHRVVDAGPLGAVLFGGQNASTYYGDTWNWTGTDWVQASPIASPSNRAHFVMCYDPRNNNVVLFSGWTGGSYPADTWLYDGQTWTRAAGTTPPGRDWAGMAYDPISQRVILYGGHDWQRSTAGQPNYDDTWAWDGQAWTQLTPINVPPHRWGHAMALDQGLGVIVMHGGTAGNDTWLWTGADWLQVPTANAPPARTRPGAAHDPLRQRLVLWGGSVGGAAASDVWEFDGNDWTQRTPSGTAPAVSDTSGIFDGGLGAIVNFGGALVPNRSSTSNATDAYGPVSPATARTFGSGCAGSAGVPAIDASRLAWLGGSYEVTVRSTPPSTSLWFVVGGSNTRTTTGLSLPFPLGVVGMPGCDLLIDPEISLGRMANASGEASFRLGIPALPVLLGVSIYAQSLVVSPGANVLGVITSDASEHVFGGR